MSNQQINIKTVGAGIPFVFQHGLGANISQAEQLLGQIKGIKWVFMDMPGHGNSILTNDATPSFDFYTDTVVSSLDKLGINAAHFGGISMGAGIALNMALRYPEKVQGLFLVRPAWINEPSPDNLKILLKAANLIGRSDGIEEFKKELAFLAISSNLPKAAEALLSVFDSKQQKSLPTVLKAMVNDQPYSKLEELKNINLPCMILGNDDDPLHPQEIADITHRNIAGSAIHKIPSRYLDSARHKIKINELITKYILTNEQSLERN